MSGEPVRLFVGGLPSTVSHTQISQRFESFGEVHGVEPVPEKEGTVHASRPLQPCRGFAYVLLTPNDEASLRRCISMYNGCKWLGGVLRVEPAKPDYRQRLAKEAAQAQAQELDPELSEASQPLDMPHSSGPVHLASRDGRKVHAVAPNPVKTFFPPTRPMRIEQLSWEPIEQPPGFARRFSVLNQELGKVPKARTAPTKGDLGQQDAAGRTGTGAPAKDTASLVAPRKRLKLVVEREAEPEPEPLPQEPSSSSELAAVDFMSSDEELHQSGPALGSRFDSSEDEGVPLPAPQLHPAATTQLPDNPSLSGHAVHSASDHNDMADGSGDSEASIDRELLQNKQPEEDSEDVAEVQGSEKSFEEDADHSEGASDSSAAAHTAAAVDEGSPPCDATALKPPASVAGHEEDEDPSEPEDDTLHSDMEASGGTHPTSPDTQPAVLHEGVPGRQCEQELPAASQGEDGAPPEVQADQRKAQQEKQTLEALGRLFPKGAAFHRGKDPNIAEAAWMVNREAWMADCKAKRRMALRQQSGPKRRVH